MCVCMNETYQVKVLFTYEGKMNELYSSNLCYRSWSKLKVMWVAFMKIFLWSFSKKSKKRGKEGKKEKRKEKKGDVYHVI